MIPSGINQADDTIGN